MEWRNTAGCLSSSQHCCLIFGLYNFLFEGKTYFPQTKERSSFKSFFFFDTEESRNKMSSNKQKEKKKEKEEKELVMVFFVCVKRIAVVTLTAWLEAESTKSLCCTPVKAFNHRAIGIRFLLWNNQQTYGQGIWDNRGGIRGCLRGHIQEGVWMSTQFTSSQLEKLVEAFPRGHRDPGAGALLGGTIWVGQPLLLLSLPCQDEPWQDTERKGMMTQIQWLLCRIQREERAWA